MEKRFIQLQSRAATEGIISGYAVLWNEPSDIGSFSEKFLPDSLKPDKAGVSLYFQHDKNNLLANSRAGTLSLISDLKGLRYQAELPSFAADKKELIKRGDIGGVSVSFVPEKDNWNGDNRTIVSAILYEISLTDKPAHKTTLDMRGHRLGKKYRWNKLIIGA